jgi:hypothetical protein
VAFSDLKDALEHFAPIIAQQYPPQIQKELAERARNSYPE